MTVKQLIQALQAYGDNAEVRITYVGNDRDRREVARTPSFVDIDDIVWLDKLKQFVLYDEELDGETTHHFDGATKKRVVLIR